MTDPNDYLSEAQPDEPPDEDARRKDDLLERRLMSNEVWKMEMAESTFTKPV